MVGQTISHYRIVEKIGEGGMGVVYKAQDLKLDRIVALKFLAPHLVQDEEGRKRFIREAKAAAALDHPNICTIHEIDEADGQTFIAMAFVEGQSVKDKIAERPLKLEDALDIATQTAQGMQAAHKKGVVHRDIKPANLMITPEGQVKVTDFGLAHLAGQSRLTKTDTALGTMAYMSPEQAQGQDADHRSDVWSLGVVVYEMVTGQLPFKGDYDQVVAYNILNEDPEPITAMRAGVPMELEWIVAKCLAKDAGERYQHIDELSVDLRSLRKKLESGKSTILQATPGRVESVSPPSIPLQQTALPLAPSEGVVPKRKLRLQQALFAVTAIALLAVSFFYLRQAPPQPPEAPLRRFAFTPPLALDTAITAGVAISPNGKHIAFTAAGAEGELWVQDLDHPEPRAIEGTEGARYPFWSPGSDFIGFAAGEELKKVAARGGLVIRLCEMPTRNFEGGSWSPDGESIVFSSGSPRMLYEVPARGGAPNLLVSPEQSDGSSSRAPTGEIFGPHFLPSEAGDRVLVFAFGSSSAATMMVQDLETGRRELLGPGDFAFYSPSGHLVHQPNLSTHELWALPFSLETLKAGGEAFPISENSRYPTVAGDQTLVYLDGAGSGQQQLVWLDRRGEKTGEIGVARDRIYSPALSPDGRLVAITATEGSNRDVWVYDIARGVRTRLSTSPARDWRPVWSPSAEEVAFTSDRAGYDDIFLRHADGSGEEQVLVATPHRELLSDWSRDGKYLLYRLNDPETGPDLWYLERNEDGSGWEPHPFLQTPSSEVVPRFSPDGRYVAYVSNESGQFEVYVQPFPEGGRKVTVSSNGGTKVRWSRDGKELFYVEGETLVAVSVSSGSSFSVGSATRLFEHPGLRLGGNYAPYDVSADGQRFVMVETLEQPSSPVIRVVQNWFAEFRDRQQQ